MNETQIGTCQVSEEVLVFPTEAGEPPSLRFDTLLDARQQRSFPTQDARLFFLPTFPELSSLVCRRLRSSCRASASSCLRTLSRVQRFVSFVPKKSICKVSRVSPVSCDFGREKKPAGTARAYAFEFLSLAIVTNAQTPVPTQSGSQSHASSYFLANARALGTLEGMAKQIEPSFNILSVVYPFALSRARRSTTNMGALSLSLSREKTALLSLSPRSMHQSSLSTHKALF